MICQCDGRPWRYGDDTTRALATRSQKARSLDLVEHGGHEPHKRQCPSHEHQPPDHGPARHSCTTTAIVSRHRPSCARSRVGLSHRNLPCRFVAVRLLGPRQRRASIVHRALTAPAASTHRRRLQGGADIRAAQGTGLLTFGRRKLFQSGTGHLLAARRRASAARIMGGGVCATVESGGGQRRAASPAETACHPEAVSS